MAILVTGGSSGIGRAVAEHFATPGNDVFINYHSVDSAAAEAADAIRAKGANPHLIKANVGTAEGVDEVIRQVGAKVSRLDQLVHCAAKTYTGPLLEADPAELVEAVEVNALALVSLTREAGPLLAKGSAVVFLSSRGARFVVPNYGALGIAKALAEHIVRYLAVEMAPRGVRVNTLSLGPVETAAFRAMFPNNYKDRLAAAAAANPTGRGVVVEDAAVAIDLLTRPELEMMQGQTVTVDGGLSL